MVHQGDPILFESIDATASRIWTHRDDPKPVAGWVLTMIDTVNVIGKTHRQIHACFDHRISSLPYFESDDDEVKKSIISTKRASMRTLMSVSLNRLTTIVRQNWPAEGSLTQSGLANPGQCPLQIGSDGPIKAFRHHPPRKKFYIVIEIRYL